MEKSKSEIFFIWIFIGNKNNLQNVFVFKESFSEAAFRAMDRNKDGNIRNFRNHSLISDIPFPGYITKGELKLAKKKMSMKEVDATIKDYDLDNDGK